ncbi:MAG: plastocyanin [Betaproteobacteria bacterium]|nr:plastocyanin [Betaproteobacteria bacterium]
MKTLTIIFATLLASSAGGVFAHGDEAKSAKSAKAATAHKEQQPWGVAGDAKAVRRTIEISMSDTFRFSPDNIEVRRGETVRFVVKNGGKLMHEMVIGTRKALDEHAALMLKFPKMEHDEPYMAHVAPGKSVDLVWQFNRAGEFHIGCLVAGHFEAGMIGKVVVR